MSLIGAVASSGAPPTGPVTPTVTASVNPDGTYSANGTGVTANTDGTYLISPAIANADGTYQIGT